MTSNDLMALVQLLERRGVKFEAKPDGGIRVKSPTPLEPELLEQVRLNKTQILELLSQPVRPAPPLPLANITPLEPLPLDLHALVRAASSGVLPKGAVNLGTGFTVDLERYVLGFAAQYLTGDQSHALENLRAALGAWLPSRMGLN